MKCLLLTLILVPLLAGAQAPMPVEFPADVTSPTADALRERIVGKSYAVQPASGPGWKIEFQSGGHAYLDVSTGSSDKGTWRADDGKLCIEWKRLRGGCSEVRLQGEAIYLKRVTTGEVVLLTVR